MRSEPSWEFQLLVLAVGKGGNSSRIQACSWEELPWEFPLQVCGFNLIYHCRSSPGTTQSSGLICNLITHKSGGSAGGFSHLLPLGRGPWGVSEDNFYFRAAGNAVRAAVCGRQQHILAGIPAGLEWARIETQTRKLHPESPLLKCTVGISEDKQQYQRYKLRLHTWNCRFPVILFSSDDHGKNELKSDSSSALRTHPQW